MPLRPPESRDGADLELTVGRSEPKPLSWPSVAALTLVGGALIVGFVGSVAHGPKRPVREAHAAQDIPELGAAIEAYRAQQWDDAERMFQAIQARHPGDGRVQSYLERIALTRRDAERLAQAEEALVAGDLERARTLAAAVPPNSALFAQAERLARGAGGDAEGAGGRRAPLDVDLRVALGEALALYADGQFEEAAARAEGLSSQASWAARKGLSDWAEGVLRFARAYRALPADPSAWVGASSEVRKLIELDDYLSEGTYARSLRTQLSGALTARAEQLLNRGAVADACAVVREARGLRSHEGRVLALERRCEAEAQRKLIQARALGRQRSDAARALYEQVRATAPEGSAPHRAAEQALGSSARR